jgi:hypothetical protein
MKTLLLTSLIAITAVLTGCASPNAVVVFCADVPAFNAVVATIPVVPPKVTADIATAKPIVDLVCANPASVDSTSLQTLLTTGLPLVLDIANVVPTTPEVKVIIADIDIAQAVLPGMIALAKQNEATVSK